MSAAGRSQLLSAPFLLLSLVILIVTIPKSSTAADDSSSPHYVGGSCMNGNASTNVYKDNLDTLLASIVNDALTKGDGYKYDSVGVTPNQVYGLAQCRGNVTVAVCGDCLTTLARNIVQDCPGNRSAVQWYEQCFLRYSDQNFYSPSIADIDTGKIQDAPSPQAFNRSVMTLLDDLAQKAARISYKMFAYGSTRFNDSLTIYGLVQCTRDLSAETCFKCLTNFNMQITKLWGIKLGVRLFGLNCCVRYDNNDFAIYDVLSPSQSPSPLPRPALSPSPTNITGRAV